MAFSTYQDMATPTFGITGRDFGRRAAPRWDAGTVNAAPVGTGASLTAAASVQDLAQGNAAVAVDTTVPLMGFVWLIAILAAIRFLWEWAEE